MCGTALLQQLITFINLDKHNMFVMVALVQQYCGDTALYSLNVQDSSK